MTNADATPESFFGSLVLEPELGVEARDAHAGETQARDTEYALQRRVEDLSAQIEFLDSETARYRESLEAERVRHAKELLDLTHQTDRLVDDARRNERQRVDEVHDSYRSQLVDRQMELEATITDLNAQHVRELHAERERHKDIIADQRMRLEHTSSTAAEQLTEELTDAHRLQLDALTTEVEQLSSTVDRLQRLKADHEVRLADVDIEKLRETRRAQEAERRITVLEQQYQVQLDDLQAQVAKAEERVSAERRRAAATVAEVLEHSASIATETDTVRSEAAEHMARADSFAASVRKQARFEYDVLAEESDERAYRASVREAELEDIVTSLRAQLARYQTDE